MICMGTGTGIAQETSIDQAVSWYQSGEFNRARQGFFQIIERQPNHPVVLYHLGRLETAPLSAEQYYLQVL